MDMCFVSFPGQNNTERHRSLCGFELGPVLRQQRPHLLRQEFAEMPVDDQFAGQKLDRVLPFEAAQVRLVNEVASSRCSRSGGRALLNRHREKERRRNSPSPRRGLGHAVTIPGAKGSAYNNPAARGYEMIM
jgi:hypothetical protein